MTVLVCPQNATLPNMTNILLTASEMASGMAYVHSLGILHGDLKGIAASCTPAQQPDICLFPGLLFLLLPASSGGV